MSIMNVLYLSNHNPSALQGRALQQAHPALLSVLPTLLWIPRAQSSQKIF